MKSSNSKVTKTHFPNGNKKSELHHAGDSLHGLWSRWHYNGQLSFQGNYVNGKPDGLHVSWFEDGVKSHEKIYLNGVPKSETQWYPNGKKREEKDGNSRIGWHDNGQIKIKFPLPMNGPWCWHRDGKILSETYHNEYGEPNTISYYQNGQKEFEGNSAGQFQWYENGQLKTFQTEDTHVRYYENGQKEFEENREGRSDWYKDGTLSSTTF